ncbi:MAG: hypothetical protein ABIZ04_22645 [Opitutus sp.]
MPISPSTLLRDTQWAECRTRNSLLIGLVTFGILALELGLIRWTSSQVRVFAYFNNLVLIGSFLGIGLGVALGKRWPGLVHLAMPALLILALPLAFSESLGLVHMVFPDNSIVLFGGEILQADWGIFARNMSIFLGLFSWLVLVFVGCGAPLGYLFSRLPTLKAYTADLTGSLIGVLAFSVASWLEAGPTVWLSLASLPFVWLSRRWWSLAAALSVILLGAYSGQHAFFSPYNRIILNPPGVHLFEQLEVNRDFHQVLANLSDDRLAAPQPLAADRYLLRRYREYYDLPFAIGLQRGSALIVGGGTGNDVQAALRNGFQHVTSVDIDRRIIEMGRTHHPEHPYSDPRVTVAIDDARAAFAKQREIKYDVVCFGLLDSHAMVSAMSTLRLDNYVYTEEGIRAAWERVAPGGHLSVALSCYAGPWFFERVYWTVARATGKRPRAFVNNDMIAATFLVDRNGAGWDPAVMSKHTEFVPIAPLQSTVTTSDDWPFLYFRPNLFPWGYALMLSFILLLAAVTVRPVFGVGTAGTRMDWPLFLMGAAFLLIETRGVTSLSLLFGSTWAVNSAIFAGILVMVLLGNLAVQRWRWSNPLPWFPVLFLAVALLWSFPISWLQTLPLGLGGVLGSLLTGLPVGLAGIIVPMLLARSRTPEISLGSNLLGAVLGGCLEYFSMFGGLRSVALLALVLYLVSYLLVRRRVALPANGPVLSPISAEPSTL